ncbi:hypothetical protein ACLOJK_039118 [Asimina triloba]
MSKAALAIGEGRRGEERRREEKMAESAVNFLIEHLGPFLVDEVKLLKGVRGEFRKIRDELESTRAFLRDADAKEHHDESIKAWVTQVNCI